MISTTNKISFVFIMTLKEFLAMWYGCWIVEFSEWEWSWSVGDCLVRKDGNDSKGVKTASDSKHDKIDLDTREELNIVRLQKKTVI